MVGKTAILDQLMRGLGPQITREQAAHLFDRTFQIIADELAKRHRVVIENFGAFEPRTRNKSEWTSPINHQTYPPKKIQTVAFIAAPRLKKSIKAK